MCVNVNMNVPVLASRLVYCNIMHDPEYESIQYFLPDHPIPPSVTRWALHRVIADAAGATICRRLRSQLAGRYRQKTRRAADRHQASSRLLTSARPPNRRADASDVESAVPARAVVADRPP